MIEAFDLQKRRAAHWAWKAVKPQSPPQIKNANWPKSPIDNFVLAKLEEKSLEPAVAADKGVLLRRAYFDLIGLPPTPEQVDAFIHDSSPGAFEKVVDGLLALPQFGERWGRHWLDLVRYAESRGHEFDYPIPNAYQYRDYVIRALNADLPYDQFVKEHLAGDLLPNPRLNPEKGFNESILGTGFWFLGESLHSPVDIRQDEADRFDNMVDVSCKTFLGLTVACARCHDHKFDAIGTKDYYSMFGFLQSSNYRLVRFESLEHNRKIAQQLWNLRAESRPVIAKAVAQSMRPSLDRLSDYLLAAREVIQAGPERENAVSPNISNPNDDVVFEDFEKGTYEGWEVTGTAFGKGPQTLETIAPYQGKINAVGKYFVNSHQVRGGEDTARGDAHTGKMTSKTFTIDHPYINMLVGGGAQEGKTCVNLLVGGKVALSATGRDNNQMFPVTWDVQPYLGKNAQIQIVDDATGGWGNIGVDQIVFTRKAHAEVAQASTASIEKPAAYAKRIPGIASAHNLDPAMLTAWVTHLLTVVKDPSDPFALWAQAAQAAQAALNNHGAQSLEQIARPIVQAAQQNLAAAEKALKSEDVVVDYAKPGPEDWFPDGVSFGPGPVKPGDIRLGNDAAHPIETICTQAAAEFDPAWDGLKLAAGASNEPGALGYNRSGRTLSTRSFAITSGRVWFLARGHGHAYAAVDKHALINGPLHGQLVNKFESKGGFQWQSIDLSAYNEHRAHLEFTSESRDFAIARVIQSEPASAATYKKQSAALIKMLSTEAASPDSLAKGYQRLMLDAVSKLEADPKAGAAAEGAEWASLTDWLVRHPALTGAGGNKGAAEAAKTFIEAQAKLASEIQNESKLALAMMEGSGEDEYVMKRGSWKNRGETAPRQLLEGIAGIDQPKITRGSGRLELADRMTAPTNPFFTRVIVNRLWQHLYGKGIVASVDNFGVLGARPTHPELLDFLADEFVKNGWSIKKMIRTLMLTSTYQMASTATAKGDESDPDNQLLHRMNIRRLEGEIVRDSILSISGRIDTKMYGPSIPIYLNEFMQGRGRPASGPLDGEGRRSIYMGIYRNFLSPMMMAFDTPSPFNTMGRRAVSNVPAQALILMNDPMVVQQAQVWAKRILSIPGLTREQRIARMYMMAFSRQPQDAENAAALAFLDQQAQELGVDASHRSDDARVWADLGHALMNVKEFIFVN